MSEIGHCRDCPMRKESTDTFESIMVDMFEFHTNGLNKHEAKNAVRDFHGRLVPIYEAEDNKTAP